MRGTSKTKKSAPEINDRTMVQRRTITGPNLKRLAHLTRVPNSAELDKMLAATTDYGQHIVQITWTTASSNQPSGSIYTLELNVNRSPFEDHHHWIFYAGNAAENIMQWNYETADASLIHNMLLCAFAEEALAPEAHSSYAYSSAAEATTRKQPSEIKEEAPRTAVHKPETINKTAQSTKMEAGLPHHAAPQSVSSHSPQNAPGTTQGTLILNGNLEKLRIDVLMQSLAASKLSGRVSLTGENETAAVIFFDQGVPVHCLAGNCEGEDALVEVLSLRRGNFEVFDDEPSFKRTIERRLDFLLMESANFTSAEEYLRSYGIDSDSVLSRTEAKATPNQAQSELTAADSEIQERFLAMLDNENKISDLVRLLNLSRPAWTRLVQSLLRQGLVRKHSGAYSPEASKVQPPKPSSGGPSLRDNLLNKSTGFYSFDYFKVLLSQELNRYIVHRRPFAVLLIHVRQEPGPKIELAALTGKMQEIGQLLRPSDYFCHFEGSSLAIILTETDGTEAHGLVQQILNFLADPLGVPGEGHLWLKIGSAAVPDDCENIETLLKIAQHPDHSKVLRLQ